MRLLRFAPLVLCLLLPASAAAAVPAERPCVASRSTTVVKSLQARVYVRGGDNEVLVGCNRVSGRRTVLARGFSCECSIADEPDPQVWLAGRHVAVNQYFCPPDASPCSGSMRVFDLRSGRALYGVITGALIDLVIKPNGSIGYLLGQQLYRYDSRGRQLLDEGPGIDGGSLAVNRTRLYWLHDNVPRTAPLR